MSHASTYFPNAYTVRDIARQRALSVKHTQNLIVGKSLKRAAPEQDVSLTFDFALDEKSWLEGFCSRVEVGLV